MNISRITKAIAVARPAQNYKDAENIRDKSIDLYLSPQPTETDYQMAQVATALVLRCFKGKIRVHSSYSNTLLRALLEAEGQKMGAVERLDFSPGESGPWRLAIGHQIPDAISADASGWTARINGVFSEKSPAAPPAITFAIACAVAKLFNHAIFDAHQNAQESWDFCLLRFLSGGHVPIRLDRQINIGRIGLLGAGATGSALGCVLSISDWSGKLEVIDDDIYQEPNLETCVFADIRDVNRPLHKALALAESLKGKKIEAIERRCRVETGAKLLTEQWDAFVCAVDNPETRRILDDTNARILLNAGVGSSKHDLGWVLWTQHGDGGHAKLSSLYQADSEVETAGEDDVPEEFREKCSRISYQGVSLALPFVGLAAGSLLAASLFQHASGKRTPLSFIQLDLFGKQHRMTVR